MSERVPLKDRIAALAQEYGPTALVVYLVIFAAVFASFATGISMGFEPESAAGSAGVIGAAWVATKVTQPFRIMGTFILTPIAARVFRRPGAAASTDVAE